MTTVQLAISDADYLRSVRTLLLEDGDHEVLVVDQPVADRPGVIVVDSDLLDLTNVVDPSRYVVIAERNAYYHTAQLWHAGLHRVLYHGDPPETVLLAVLSIELTQSRC